MGHSLGGVVAAVLAEQSVLPARDVIAWSAPFGGSALLLWGKPFYRFPEGIIYDDFCPTSAKLAALRASMASSSVRYFGITGTCDPLVRPASAVLPFFTDDSVVMPHLGHYNIMVSLVAWHRVIERLDLIVS